MKKIILLSILLQSGFVFADPVKQILDCKVEPNNKNIISFELFGALSEDKPNDTVNITNVASIVGVDYHVKTKILAVGGKGGSSSGISESTGNMSVNLLINRQQVTLKADRSTGTLIFSDETIELSKCTNMLDLTAGMYTN